MHIIHAHKYANLRRNELQDGKQFKRSNKYIDVESEG